MSPMGWMPIGGALYGNGSWTTASADIVAPADRDYMLVFLWYNNGNDCCGDLPAAVDNISIVQVPCYGVTNLDLESLTALSSSDCICRRANCALSSSSCRAER